MDVSSDWQLFVPQWIDSTVPTCLLEMPFLERLVVRKTDYYSPVAPSEVEPLRRALPVTQIDFVGSFPFIR